MPKPFPIQLPTKGVNRNAARSSQSPDTAWDALNVYPYDRYGRLRPATRPGLIKQWAGALGAPSPVALLQQTTIALDPTTITADQSLLNETFTYANGNLDTVSGGAWQTRNGGPDQWAAAIDVTKAPVVSNAVTAGVLLSPASRYTGSTLALGTAYVMKLAVTIPVGGTSTEVAVATRINNSAPVNSASVRLSVFGGNSLKIVANGVALGASVNTGLSLATGVPFVLEMRVNGDNFTGWIDGIQYISRTSNFNSAQVGVGFAVVGTGSGWTLDNFQVFTGKSLASYRQTNIVAVSGGGVYQGDISTQATLATGGASALGGASRPSGAAIFGKMYLVDGVSTMKVLDIATRSVSTWASTAGTETATTLGQYQIAAVYRGRLVLGADRLLPQNFTMSRVGTPTDFDYTQTDPSAAQAGNAAVSGRIGEPIVSLMPFNDDVLLIGGDHNLWKMDGDIGFGGTINNLSDAIGILGTNAWTKSPDGTIYFVGTGGLFRMAPGGSAPEILSNQTYNQFFAGIDRGQNYVTMTWNRDLHGAYIFITPVNTGSTTHLWYDARNGGLWPIQYPDAHGPLSVLVYDGDRGDDRRVMLGGRDGFVRVESDTARTDDGTAISSYVVLGPFQPFGPGGDGVITALDITGGEVRVGDASNVWNMNWELRGGKAAYEVTEGTPRHKAAGGFSAAGRQNNRVTRVRGGWFAVKIYNTASGNYWSLEQVTAHCQPQGRQR